MGSHLSTMKTMIATKRVFERFLGAIWSRKRWVLWPKKWLKSPEFSPANRYKLAFRWRA